MALLPGIPDVVLGAVALLVLEVLAVAVGWALRPWLPFRGAFWHAIHGKALQVEHERHDVVAEVEWPDERVTYMGADYSVEDEALVLKNGLKVKVRGRGADPVYISGVPIVRVRAEHACPVSTEVAIAMELEEEGEYARLTEDGREVESEPTGPAIEDGPTASDPGAAGGEPREAAADGGTPLGRDPVIADHMYDLSSPDGYDGTAFSLRTAIEYVPNAISPLDLKQAEERGKQSERQGFSDLKIFLLGMGAMFGILVLAAVMFVVFMKVMGSGGSTIGMLLPLLAAPAARRREEADAEAGSETESATKRERQSLAWALQVAARTVWRTLPWYLLGFVLGVVLLNQRILLDAALAAGSLPTGSVVVPLAGEVPALAYLSLLYELAVLAVAFVLVYRTVTVARREAQRLEQPEMRSRRVLGGDR